MAGGGNIFIFSLSHVLIVLVKISKNVEVYSNGVIVGAGKVELITWYDTVAFPVSHSPIL